MSCRPAWPRWLGWTLAVSALVASLAAQAEAADTRRLAILVGNNQGGPGQPALHYAEDDVGKVAEVLTEIGGFAAGDVHVLRGRSLPAVRAVWAS